MKKGDVLIVSLCAALCALLFALTLFSKGEPTAFVYFDGELVKTQELSEISKPFCYSVSGCELEFEKDGVSFVSSTCKDKLCIKHGKLSKNGDTMACVPQKVVVTIKQGKKDKFDMIVY